jgi:glycosyltransferase involved in cell wall biosynthesis
LAWLTLGVTGYMDTCFRALTELGNELFVVRPATIVHTPAAARRLRSRGTRLGRAARSAASENPDLCDYAASIVWELPPAEDQLLHSLSEFGPDVVTMGNWTRPRCYRATLKAQKASVLRVLFIDGQWLGTPRQWLARATHRAYLGPVFDCVIVASDRTETFARHLGFAADSMIRGGFSADTAVFDGATRSGRGLAEASSFIFAGRLVHEKGIDVLASAYLQYRARASKPWDLHIAGDGPLASQFEAIPGVNLHGFLQPRELANLLHRSSCLVLPSRFEPYGVVVHEAAAAGLPLLVSNVAGAVPGLVQDGSNGWVVPAGRAHLLADAMLRMSSSPPEQLGRMAEISRALSQRISPHTWARNVHDEFSRRIGHNSVAPERDRRLT